MNNNDNHSQLEPSTLNDTETVPARKIVIKNTCTVRDVVKCLHEIESLLRFSGFNYDGSPDPIYDERRVEALRVIAAFLVDKLGVCSVIPRKKVYRSKVKNKEPSQAF